MFNNNLCSYKCCCGPLIGWKVPATALKVQHCWTLKTTVGDCWRQSPTCAGNSRQLKYKHTHDCRCLSPSQATVGDWSIYPGFTIMRSNDQSKWRTPNTVNLHNRGLCQHGTSFAVHIVPGKSHGTQWLTCSCDQASLWMVQSVCLSVCPCVRLSPIFHYVPIVVSS